MRLAVYSSPNCSLNPPVEGSVILDFYYQHITSTAAKISLIWQMEPKKRFPFKGNWCLNLGIDTQLWFKSKLS